MAHEIDMSNNRANVAYAGNTPWHGLGVNLNKDAPISTWREEAGLNWGADTRALEYEVDDLVYSIPNKKVVFRDDTMSALGIVSDKYQAAQPVDILDTYKELTEDFGCQMEVAGALKGGRIIWALASTGQSGTIKEVDDMKGYLLLTTSFDGSMATTAKFTSVRVVCNNTLEISLAGRNAVKIPHSRKYDKSEVMGGLGLLGDSWDNFLSSANALADTIITPSVAQKWLVATFGDARKPLEEQPNALTMRRVMSLYEGQAAGAELVSAEGTAWGLLNATTEYIDHNRHIRSADSRLTEAWTGSGAVTKRKAFANAMQLI